MGALRWFLAMDIGGSRVRIGAIGKEGPAHPWHIIGDPLILDTPADPQELAQPVKAFVERFPVGPEGMVAGVAGRVVEDKGDVRLDAAPRLTPAWRDRSLQRLGAEWVGADIPSWWFNDTALVGLGEMHYGAGDSHGIAAYVTISTGVGGCRFIDGRVDTHAGSFEPGHMVIDAGGALCPSCPSCPLDGQRDWEAMASGSAITARFGKPPVAFAQEDPLWEALAEWSGIALRNLALVWTPAVIVVGGSMVVGDPAIPLAPMEEQLRANPLTRHITLRKARCGALGGLYGALHFVAQRESARVHMARAPEM